MTAPKRTFVAHGRTHTLDAQAYADKLEAYAEVRIQALVQIYRAADPEVRALLLARPVFVTVLTWASNHKLARS